MTAIRCAFAAGLLLVATVFKCEAQEQAGIVADRGTAATAFREVIGRRLTYICPANFELASVFGTDLYKDDSSICSAAIHAGALIQGRRGVVTIITGAPQAKFVASRRNGVESDVWDGMSGTYTFVRDGSPGQLDWSTTALALPADFIQPINLLCPPGGPKPAGGQVWGVDIYTEDSSICYAAVHANLITRDRGGIVTFTGSGSRTGFADTTRYGVSSYPFDGTHTSFKLSAARPTIPERSPRPAPGTAPVPRSGRASPP